MHGPIFEIIYRRFYYIRLLYIHHACQPSRFWRDFPRCYNFIELIFTSVPINKKFLQCVKLYGSMRNTFLLRVAKSREIQHRIRLLAQVRKYGIYCVCI